MRRALRFILVLTVLVSVVGCSSFGKSSLNMPVAQPVGGNWAEKTAKAVVGATKRQGSQLVARVARVLPSKNQVALAEQVVDKNDPTRLDNMPKDISPDLYVSAARLSERNGRYEQAFEQYRQALEVNPKDREALIGVARFQHRAGKWENAITVYERALSLYPQDPVIMNDLGLTYARHGKLDEAINVLRAAARVAPERELYLNNLAACLVEANRLTEAVDFLARAHGPAKAHYNVGYLLSEKGRAADAEYFLHQALVADPNLQQARALLQKVTR